MFRPETFARASLVCLALACARPDAQPETGVIETTRFASALEVDLEAMTRTESGLYYRDLALGTGASAEAGKRASVRYSGWLPNGRQFDATRPNDPAFVFRPGQGEVIAGWDEGVVGMRVGGRRQLVIPPALGYGPQGSGPIPPNSVLVFNVELVSVE